MLTEPPCNGVCDSSSDLASVTDDQCKKIVHDAAIKNDNGCLFIYNQDSFESQEQYAEKIYQKFTNVCRRGSINDEHFLSNNLNNNKIYDDITAVDHLEQYSTGIESNCTSIGTQTPSMQDANVQTTNSLESLCESPSELNDKFNLCSHARVRNFISYSRLYSSTKASSVESSVKDESTQYGDSCSSDPKSYLGNNLKISPTCCCSSKECCYIHDPFYPKDLLDLHDETIFRNTNFDPKSHFRCQCNQFSTEYRSCLKKPYSHNATVCPQQYFNHQLPMFCHCYSYLKSNEFLEKSAAPLQVKISKEKEELTSFSNNNNNNITAQNNQNDTKFEKGECSLEILNEKDKKSSNEVHEMKTFRVMKKAKSFDGLNLDIEQRRPLLSDLSNNLEKGERNGIDSNGEDEDNINDEIEKLKPDTSNGQCHCMHEFSPESIHKNCIQVRPSRKKSSNKTSPLKVITFMLFASAFLITGSAIKDAYYQ